MLSSKKRYVVIGLGKTGLSCIRYLSKQGMDVIAMDTRENPPELDQIRSEWPDLRVITGGLDKAILQQAAEIIISPGISREEPVIAECIAQGISVVGDIELFARVVTAPIIAITGTNAKGTVTTLVAQMAQTAGLKVCMGGNIGIPVLDLLQATAPDVYVLELSSFQLESTFSLKPKAAAILNFSEDHLDRHHTMANYIAAKQRIYRNCEITVSNRDDEHTRPVIPPLNQEINFGLNEPTANAFGIRYIAHTPWLAFGEQYLLPTNELRIKGRHNWSNALAALALGSALRLPFPAMLQALREFPGLPHRCQWIANLSGVDWYNDSKGTNIGATIAAIEGLGTELTGKIILIAGGLGKGADFTLLRPIVNQYVRTVILIGTDAPLLAQALHGMAEIIPAKDLEEAVWLSQQKAQAGDIVLLSPACASLDMFRDYAQRGEIFNSLVQRLSV